MSFESYFETGVVNTFPNVLSRAFRMNGIEIAAIVPSIDRVYRLFAMTDAFCFQRYLRSHVFQDPTLFLQILTNA